MTKLKKKNPKRHINILPPVMPPGGVSAPNDTKARAM
jgi:hypothetical protein